MKVVCPAHQSRPGPPTDRNRRAFPHGKACSGCAASLPPPLRTAVRRLAGRDPPTAAVVQDGRQSTSPSHWSRPGPRSGRPSPALQRGSACGDRTAPVLSPSTTLVRATDRRHWALTASAAQAERGRQITVSPAYQSRPRPRAACVLRGGSRAGAGGRASVGAQAREARRKVPVRRRRHVATRMPMRAPARVT